ncbi:Molybdenum transport system permease protein ModB [Planctomycetes bacterium Pla163]|uniref:Molybdenum transport system permease n=1 Tax=Rohdeia mirabilis TaxID=2528008 RepID=A0A518D4K2_9BACT|nr:Molybdenum transport system permease protein ModB [Planctomycetes bacterium Pla163]
MDWSALRLSGELAAVTTLVLLVIGTPLAWWLAGGRSTLRSVVETIVALPLVLPPTVLGFYLLVVMGPRGPIGELLDDLGGPKLVFTFTGLVVASVLFSLPFVVQPLRNAFRALGRRPVEAAATLGAGPVDRFLTVVVPSVLPAYVTAAVLAFAHTVGEFGVVLMIGGSLPETRVASIAVWEAVESLDYDRAHAMSAVLVAGSFVVLLAANLLERRAARGSEA